MTKSRNGIERSYIKQSTLYISNRSAKLIISNYLNKRLTIRGYILVNSDLEIDVETIWENLTFRKYFHQFSTNYHQEE